MPKQRTAHIASRDEENTSPRISRKAPRNPRRSSERGRGELLPLRRLPPGPPCRPRPRNEEPPR
eukprot:4187631-Pyramimonas_sp.AAC.1